MFVRIFIDKHMFPSYNCFHQGRTAVRLTGKGGNDMKTTHWEYDDFGAYEEELEEDFFTACPEEGACMNISRMKIFGIDREAS